MDGLGRRLADGARPQGPVRPPAQLALRLDPDGARLLLRALRLPASGPDRPPRPARPALVRHLARLLQLGADRRLGAALLPAAALPAGAHALDRLPRADGRAAADDGRALGGDPLHRPRRLPRDDQHRRLGRHRRRLRGRDRRRPDHRRRADLRGQRLPRRQSDRRHVRSGQLLRLRAVRAGLAVERQLGPAPSGARGGDLLRPAVRAWPGRARPPTRRRPAGGDAGACLARLSVQRLRPPVELERLAARRVIDLELRALRPAARPGRPAGARCNREVRALRASAADARRRARAWRRPSLALGLAAGAARHGDLRRRLRAHVRSPGDRPGPLGLLGAHPEESARSCLPVLDLGPDGPRRPAHGPQAAHRRAGDRGRLRAAAPRPGPPRGARRRSDDRRRDQPRALVLPVHRLVLADVPARDLLAGSRAGAEPEGEEIEARHSAGEPEGALASA